MNATFNEYRAVVPSDTVDLWKLTDSVYVGGTGDVAAVAQNGVAVTFVGVPAGSVLPIVCRRVNAALTTATAMVQLNAV